MSGVRVAALPPGVDIYERLYVLVMLRPLYDGGDAALVRDVLELVRELPPGTSVTLDKVRSFAASAGDTIDAGEALDVIKSVLALHIKSSRCLH